MYPLYSPRTLHILCPHAHNLPSAPIQPQMSSSDPMQPEYISHTPHYTPNIPHGAACAPQNPLKWASPPPTLHVDNQ